jgi:hypothetical protein
MTIAIADQKRCLSAVRQTVFVSCKHQRLWHNECGTSIMPYLYTRESKLEMTHKTNTMDLAKWNMESDPKHPSAATQHWFFCEMSLLPLTLPVLGGITLSSRK